MLTIALCDDDPNDLAYMLSLLDDYRTKHIIDYEYSVFHNGFELMSALEEGNTFDIYCLDIIMPNFNGIALGKEIRAYDKNAPIIFFTSSPDFALESYSVRAVNYVLKPVSKEKFSIVLDNVLEYIRKDEPESIILKSREGIQKLLLSNLLYVEAMGRNTIYHSVCGHVVTCTQKFSDTCDALLKYSCFLKPHRSYLVNMNHIEAIYTTEIKLHPSISIPIAQGKVRAVKEQYLAFQMEDFT